MGLNKVVFFLLNGNGFFYIYILLNFKFIWKNIDIDEDNFMMI